MPADPNPFAAPQAADEALRDAGSVPAQAGAALDARYQHDRYLLRRKVFTLFGAKVHIYDPAGAVAFFAKQKAFRLKEDLRIYTGEDAAQEVLRIKARTIIDLGATYDVFDPTRGEEHVGCLRRQGLASMFVQDSWLVCDPGGGEIARLREDSVLLALIRRYVFNPIPQRFDLAIDGDPVARFKQNFNPFVQKLALDFSADRQQRLDRRLGIAAALLVVLIEGRQKG